VVNTAVLRISANTFLFILSSILNEFEVIHRSYCMDTNHQNGAKRELRATTLHIGEEEISHRDIRSVEKGMSQRLHAVGMHLCGCFIPIGDDKRKELNFVLPSCISYGKRVKCKKTLTSNSHYVTLKIRFLKTNRSIIIKTKATVRAFNI